MKTLHYSIIILSTVGLLAGASNSVYAPCPVGIVNCGPPPGVIVSTGTDSQFYEKNDTISIQGRVYVQNYTKPIQVQVVNPDNATIQSIDTNVSNGTFGLKIGANFDTSGIYQIMACVQSWCDRSYFKFIAEPYKLTVNGQDFFIRYKSFADLQKIDADIGANALRVHIANATAQGEQFVIELPRALIDSQSGNSDESFKVLVGMHQPDRYMQLADYKEIASNDVSRTLAIDIPYEPIPNVNGVWDFKISPVDVLSGPAVFMAPPLKQSKSGIIADDIHCKDGFFLVISNENKPFCLKSGTISKLASRGLLYGTKENSGTTIVIPPGSENQAENKTYSPNIATIVIGINNTVRWVNQADTGNTIVPDVSGTQDGKSFGSYYVLNPGTSYQFTFTQPGTYSYHGEPHPWQKGTVIVLPSQVYQKENSTSAIKLFISIDSDIIKLGNSIGITISVNNTLATPVDIPAQNDWSYANVDTGPCQTINYGISILDGFYDEINVTQGKSLNLFDPDVNCPVIQETAKVYEFQPHSGYVKQVQCKQIEGLQCPTGIYQMGQNYTFNGYWDGGMVQPFKAGVYTLVGADEWGHVAMEHFVITNSTIFAGELGSMSCPATGGKQFGATIKNSTGFEYYNNSTQYGNTFFLHSGMQGTVNVQYAAPANASWFQNNGNAPFNLTSGAALFYMANVIDGNMITSYAVSLYNDETGHHSQVCHYSLPYGGFAEPCNFDNKGDIPLSELPSTSRLLHTGISVSFEPNSVMLYPNSNPVFTTTVSANSDATPGIYWLSLQRSLCGPGVLAKLVVLP